MEHQPFENWIIDELELTPEQNEALAAHTKVCSHCRILQTSLEQVRVQIETSPAAIPSPGFSQRFQKNLEERRLRQQLQIRRLFLFLVLGAGLSFFAWLAVIVSTTSPADLLVAGVQTITQLFVNFDVFQQTFLTVIKSVPIVVPLALWIAITCSFVFLSLVWAISVWRISFQGVYKK
jgi:hypothetical protein